MTDTLIPVMVVEDEPRTRDALCHDLEASGTCRVVASADDADTAVRLARATTPDIILMDVRLRRGTSLGAIRQMIRQILRDLPKARILIVSVAPLPDVALAVRAGAHGYIDKYASADQLVEAVMTVRRGAMHLPEPLPQYLAIAIQHDDAMRALTPQQLEVLRYVAYGYYNYEIAEALGIEKRTVNRHLENIRDRLGVHRRGDLGALGRAWGLEPPEAVVDAT
jgi:DNA-binding NarL/FixJ family response regulator